MDFDFSPEEEAFRAEARGWLEANLVGKFAQLRGRGGPGDEHALHDAVSYTHLTLPTNREV